MLKEIFIINKGGIGLFYQNFETTGRKDKDLVSAFLKIFQDLTVEYMNQSLQELQVGTDKVIFVSGEPVSFVLKVNSIMPSNKIETRIALLKDRFLRNYTEQLSQNDTDIKDFDAFEQDIKEVFDIKTKTNRKSSERLQEFFGISVTNANLKKLIESL